MTKEFEVIAIRQINAYNHLVENIENAGNITNAEAKKVADFYLKNKLAKLDAVMGRSQIKRGDFYEADVIERALEMANAK